MTIRYLGINISDMGKAQRQLAEYETSQREDGAGQRLKPHGDHPNYSPANVEQEDGEDRCDDERDYATKGQEYSRAKHEACRRTDRRLGLRQPQILVRTARRHGKCPQKIQLNLSR